MQGSKDFSGRFEMSIHFSSSFERSVDEYLSETVGLSIVMINDS